MSLKPLKPVKKAYVYMVRRQHLLVHEHVDYPEMPLALPGGTLEPGELPPLAAWREPWVLESSAHKACPSVEKLCVGSGVVGSRGESVAQRKIRRCPRLWIL